MDVRLNEVSRKYADKYAKLGIDKIDYSKVIWILFTTGSVYNMRNVFELFFMSNGDKILEWKERKISECQTPSLEAKVVLLLGSDVIPPLGPILDRLLKRKDKLTEYVEGMRALLDEERKRNPSPDLLQEIASIEELLQRLEPKVTAFTEEDLKNRYKPLPNCGNYHCHITFAPQACYICRTIAHATKDCPNRGCFLCKDRSHLQKACPQRCRCGRGAYHLKTDHKKNNQKGKQGDP